MKIIKVRNKTEALNIALNYLPRNEASICFTGGDFGFGILKKIEESKLDISYWSIFQTDERVDAEKKDNIQDTILLRLKNCKGFNKMNCYFLPCKSSGQDLRNLLENHTSLKTKTFDITFLSLGEDGHLAGHFENSTEINNHFTYTEEAPKLPKKRVSYNLKKLLDSKLIIMACLGESKKKAYEELILGTNIHSEIIKHKGLVILRD